MLVGAALIAGQAAAAAAAPKPAQKHNPFVYFSDFVDSAERMAKLPLIEGLFD